MHCAIHRESYGVGTVLLLNLAILEGEAWCLPRLLELCEWRSTLHLRFARMPQAWKKWSPDQNINQPAFYWKWKVEATFECFLKEMLLMLHRKWPDLPSLLLTEMVTTKKKIFFDRYDKKQVVIDWKDYKGCVFPYTTRSLTRGISNQVLKRSYCDLMEKKKWRASIRSKGS